VKVYATSVAEAAGSIEAGVLEEGAKDTGGGVKGVGAGRIRETSLGAIGREQSSLRHLISPTKASSQEWGLQWYRRLRPAS
jgi:hypothetical protein